jgi:hypothetical protein
MGEMRSAYIILVRKPEWKKWAVRVWTGFIWLRIGTSGGLF